MKYLRLFVALILSVSLVGAVPYSPKNFRIGTNGGEKMANNFSGDSNCKALWKLDDGALTTDSQGSNTLTNNNSVTANTSDYQEGDASADLDSGSSMSLSIADASLNSGFPLKSGDTNKKISVCMWFKPTSVTATQVLFGKYSASSNKRTWMVRIQGNNSKIAMYIGYNSGASYENEVGSTALTAGRWYHLGATFDDSDGSCKIRIWDDTASSVIDNYSGSFANAIYVGSEPVYLGRDSDSSYFDGLLDEVVVFSDVLTTDEIDEIRAGTYGGGAYTLDMGAGSYTLSGQTVSLLKDSVLGMGAGSYELTGQDVALNKGFHIGMDGGSYTLSGQDLTFIRDLVLAVESGSYTLTGQDVGLLFGFLLDVEAGSYTLSGQDVGFVRDLVIEVLSGVYTLTGSDVELVYTPAVLTPGTPSLMELLPLLKQ